MQPIAPHLAANCTPTIHLLLQSTSDSHGSQTLSAPPPEYASSRTYRRPNPVPNGRPTDRLLGRNTSGPPFGRIPATHITPKITLCHPQAQIATKPHKSRSRFAFQGRHCDRVLFWLQIHRHLGSPQGRHLCKQRTLSCTFVIGCANYKMHPSVGLNGNLPWSGDVLVICHPRPNLKIL